MARRKRLEILIGLLRQRDYEVPELAKRLGVSRFTIYRDLLIIQTERADECALVRKCVWGSLRKCNCQ